MQTFRSRFAVLGLVLACAGCATQLDSRDTDLYSINADDLKARTEDVLKQNDWTIVAETSPRVTKAFLVSDESGGPRTDVTIRYKEVSPTQSRATIEGTSAGDFNKWSLGIQGLANKSKATRAVTRVIRDLGDKVNGAPPAAAPKP